jgi:hypothetical protein
MEKKIFNTIRSMMRWYNKTENSHITPRFSVCGGPCIEIEKIDSDITLHASLLTIEYLKNFK